MIMHASEFLCRSAGTGGAGRVGYLDTLANLTFRDLVVPRGVASGTLESHGKQKRSHGMSRFFFFKIMHFIDPLIRRRTSTLFLGGSGCDPFALPGWGRTGPRRRRSSGSWRSTPSPTASSLPRPSPGRDPWGTRDASSEQRP